MVSNIHRTKFSTGALVLLISLLFAGCGGGGETGPQGLATLVRVESEAPGSHCSAGGSRIVAGSDTNGDATLDAAEVSSTQYVCNAAPGAVGAAGTTGAVGSDGFSTRFMWRTAGQGEVYVYMPSSTRFGTSLGRGSFHFEPGKWHCIEQQLSLNTPGQADGKVEVWLDAQPVCEQGALLFRTVPVRGS